MDWRTFACDIPSGEKNRNVHIALLCLWVTKHMLINYFMAVYLQICIHTDAA